MKKTWTDPLINIDRPSKERGQTPPKNVDGPCKKRRRTFELTSAEP